MRQGDSSLDLECRSPCVVSLGKLRQCEEILGRLSWKTTGGGRPYKFRLTSSLKNQSCAVVKGVKSQVGPYTPLQTNSPSLAPLSNVRRKRLGCKTWLLGSPLRPSYELAGKGFEKSSGVHVKEQSLLPSYLSKKE